MTVSEDLLWQARRALHDVVRSLRDLDAVLGEVAGGEDVAHVASVTAKMVEDLRAELEPYLVDKDTAAPFRPLLRGEVAAALEGSTSLVYHYLRQGRLARFPCPYCAKHYLYDAVNVMGLQFQRVIRDARRLARG